MKNTVQKYRKKPVVIEAVQFTGENGDAIYEWANPSGDAAEAPITIDLPILTIYTLDGNMEAKHGDYIIKGVKGEFYPCKPDIFEATYDPAP